MSNTSTRDIKVHRMHTKVAKGDKITEREEEAIHGEKGLSFKLFIREGNDKKKYIGKIDSSKKDGTYRYIEIHNDDKKEVPDLTLDKLLDHIKKNKELEFVFKILDKKKVAKGGARKSSKKTSKKVLKKVSKKASKKVSKKRSKRVAKK